MTEAERLAATIALSRAEILDSWSWLDRTDLAPSQQAGELHLIVALARTARQAQADLAIEQARAIVLCAGLLP